MKSPYSHPAWNKGILWPEESKQLMSKNRKGKGLNNKSALGNEPNKTSFVKGQIAWNKGLKRTWFSPTEFKKGTSPSPATQFKKGEARLILKGEKNRGWKGGRPKCEVCTKFIQYKAKRCWECSLKIRKGENSPGWKGGITPFVRALRTCFKYRQWRSDVFTRDNFTCTWCGTSHHNIQADHIKKFVDIIRENNIKSLDDANDCEELWNINNGRTLCAPCHRKTDTYGTKRPKK